MPSCSGICQTYKAGKKQGRSRYAAGQKRCSICEVFMEYDGVFCPCCKKRLRAASRHTDSSYNDSEIGKVKNPRMPSFFWNPEPAGKNGKMSNTKRPRKEKTKKR